jgi:DNA mismatch repair protein MutL
MANQSFASQQLLFPEQVDLNKSDAALMGQLIQEFTELGFDIEPFGESDFIVRGVPADLTDASPQELIEGILENFEYSKKEKAIDRRKKLAKSMAVEGAKVLSKKFNQALAAPLVDRLFACEQPFSAPSGQTSVLLLSSEELASHFK